MRSILLLLLAATLYTACADNKAAATNEKQQAIKEIETAERYFQKMSADKSISEAFWFFADSNAIIKRENDTLIHGREAIRNYYAAPFYANAAVTWAPDFTDASDDGKFGYTYGKYTWQSKDSTGKLIEFKGVFHTVWKKQPNGSWKFVWD